MGIDTYIQSTTYAGRLVGSEAFQERLAKLKHRGHLQV